MALNLFVWFKDSNGNISQGAFNAVELNIQDIIVYKSNLVSDGNISKSEYYTADTKMVKVVILRDKISTCPMELLSL